MHSLTWEEAQIAAGVDPDFHRRDLYDAIENGAFPEWDLGIQVFPDTPEETFEGIDLLDPTKIVPEELAPVQVIGTLVLNGNPTNFFAETEQVAFHTGHLVPGIEPTNDPLLQGRNFSYLDTQLTRLGGPNFTQIPINRPHAPVNDNTRDGFHQHAVHTGQAPYTPNSVDDGVPFPADWAEGGYVNVPRHVEGDVVRAAPGLVRRPLLPAGAVLREPDQRRAAARRRRVHLRARQVLRAGASRSAALTVLARIDADLCAQVAAGLGLPVPETEPVKPRRRTSPALRADQADALPDRRPDRRRGRRAGRRPRRDRHAAQGAGGRGRAAAGDRPARRAARRPGSSVEIVERTFATGRSIEFDAIVVADGAPKDGDFRALVMLQEAFRHLKAVGAWGDGAEVLAAAGIDRRRTGRRSSGRSPARR